MAEDRHKHNPKSVRFPGGLLAWLPVQAATEGRKPNAVIVAALEEYRANHDAAPLPAPAAPRTVRRPELRDESDCRHPADQVDAGECQACGADVW